MQQLAVLLVEQLNYQLWLRTEFHGAIFMKKT